MNSGSDPGFRDESSNAPMRGDSVPTSRGVVVWLKDGRQTVVEDAFIAGIWRGDLIISRDRTGTGFGFDVERSIALAGVDRVEVVELDSADADQADAPSWSVRWDGMQGDG
jgi:hypothetical protein